MRRLAEHRSVPYLDDTWRAQVDAMGLPDEFRAALLDPARVYDTIASLPVPVARACHALTHTTISPNVGHGGQKTNVIPDTVDIDVDIRTVPGVTSDDVDDLLADAWVTSPTRSRSTTLQSGEATQSAIDNPLWDVLARNVQVVYPGAKIVPGLIVGGTDGRFYRERGRVAYGAGLFSPEMTSAAFGNRFHGHDERIDVDSLALATQFWIDIASDLLS